MTADLERRTIAAELHAPDAADSPGDADPLAGRRLVGRVVPYGETSRRPIAPGQWERFAPGVFAATEPGLPLRDEHGRVVGQLESLDERADGLWGTFRVSAIPLGDDVLTLVREGAYRGLSVGFATDPDPKANPVATIEGRPVVTRRRAELVEVSVTGSPAYRGATITGVRALTGAPERGEPMADETIPTPEVVAPAEIVSGPSPEVLTRMEAIDERLAGAVDAIRRMEVATVPAAFGAERHELREFVGLQLRALALSDRSAREELERRALDHTLSSEILGVIPPAYSREVLDRAAPARPYWSTTRTLPAPSAGITAQLPRITARPVVGEQATEKTELASGPVTITSEAVNMQTVGWAGNVSLQAVERSDPPFLEILTDEMSAAYALATELEAVQKLVAATTTAGGVLGPTGADVIEQLALAVGTSYTASSRRVWADTAWANLAGWTYLAALADSTGRPLFTGAGSSVNAVGATTIGGAATGGGSVLGLRLVLAPDLPATHQVVVGPSQGFAHMEDGPRRLSVSEPSVLGVEVAIYGYIWTHALWPLAFTEFTVPAGVFAASASSKKGDK